MVREETPVGTDDKKLKNKPKPGNKSKGRSGGVGGGSGEAMCLAFAFLARFCFVSFLRASEKTPCCRGVYWAAGSFFFEGPMSSCGMAVTVGPHKGNHIGARSRAPRGTETTPGKTEAAPTTVALWCVVSSLFAAPRIKGKGHRKIFLALIQLQYRLRVLMLGAFPADFPAAGCCI